MIPLRVYLEGFMSYRDSIELFFEGASLWALAGSNGAGKSAIFDAITYALYGKHRGGTQNAKALINDGADRLKVQFDFEVGPNQYRAERMLKCKGGASCQAYCIDGPNPPQPRRPLPQANSGD